MFSTGRSLTVTPLSWTFGSCLIACCRAHAHQARLGLLYEHAFPFGIVRYIGICCSNSCVLGAVVCLISCSPCSRTLHSVMLTFAVFIPSSTNLTIKIDLVLMWGSLYFLIQEGMLATLGKILKVDGSGPMGDMGIPPWVSVDTLDGADGKSDAPGIVLGPSCWVQNLPLGHPHRC